jgi:hypothetical protein
MKLDYCREPPRSISRFDGKDADPSDVSEKRA